MYIQMYVCVLAHAGFHKYVCICVRVCACVYMCAVSVHMCMRVPMKVKRGNQVYLLWGEGENGKRGSVRVGLWGVPFSDWDVKWINKLIKKEGIRSPASKVTGGWEPHVMGLGFKLQFFGGAASALSCWAFPQTLIWGILKDILCREVHVRNF